MKRKKLIISIIIICALIFSISQALADTKIEKHNITLIVLPNQCGIGLDDSVDSWFNSSIYQTNRKEITFSYNINTTTINNTCVVPNINCSFNINYSNYNKNLSQYINYSVSLGMDNTRHYITNKLTEEIKQGCNYDLLKSDLAKEFNSSFLVSFNKIQETEEKLNSCITENQKKSTDKIICDEKLKELEDDYKLRFYIILGLLVIILILIYYYNGGNEIFDKFRAKKGTTTMLDKTKVLQNTEKNKKIELEKY